jgi:segregation and condensation protein B
MSDQAVLPELKQIIGAMLFASKTPITVGDIRRCLEEVAEAHGGPVRDFAAVTLEDIRTALESLGQLLEAQKLGFHIVEMANGFRLENDANCGLWLRHLLQKGRPNRLSKPALETLAIIAYRQPCTRAEIESVRGVAVDQILRNLMDMQLIRITGRSELPGRPWMFGTAQKFLEYFGLRDVKELPGVEELRRMEEEQERKRAEAPAVEAAEPVLQLETPARHGPGSRLRSRGPQRLINPSPPPNPAARKGVRMKKPPKRLLRKRARTRTTTGMNTTTMMTSMTTTTTTMTTMTTRMTTTTKTTGTYDEKADEEKKS